MANNEGIKSIMKNLSEAPSTGSGGGQAAGQLELVSTPVEKAAVWIKENHPKFDLEKEIPNFEKNYKLAQQAAGKYGKTRRKDMPVIDDKDVRRLQTKLKEGKFDINAPYAEETEVKNPFPEGLKGKEAEEFLKRGLTDGSKPDDMVKVTNEKKKVKDLIPIQRQIYVDISLGETMKYGVDATKDFITKKSFFIVSSDNRIIDGHHRFLSGMLVDPNIAVQCMVIDLPINKLLPLSIAFGDAVGNKRNQ